MASEQARKDVLNICVIPGDGQGAVIAGVLALAGNDVTLVTERHRVGPINSLGLVVETPQGQRTASLRALDTGPEGRFDLVIISGRPSEMTATMALAGAVLRQARAVSCIQNSVDFTTLKQASSPETLLIGGSVTEFFHWTGDNTARADRPTDVDAYTGSLDPRPEAKHLAQRLADDINKGGLIAKCTDAIEQVIWEKQLQLANAAGWSALTLLGNRELTLCDGLAAPTGAEQFVTTAHELLTIYRAMGHEPQDFYGPRSLLGTIAKSPSREAAVDAVTAAGKRHLAAGLRVRTPMHDDILNHRKTEADAVFPPFIEQAAKLNQPAPLMSAVYRSIKLWEDSWRS